MKKTINFTLIALMLFAFFGATSMYGQEWSKEQKSVWKEVEKGWEAWKNGDSDGAFSGIHDKYLGWNNDDPLPISKSKWKNTYEMWKEYITVEYYDIQPARIVVYDDYATVYYFWEMSMVFEKDGKKKNKNMEGRNVEFFVNEKGKWMLFGDMSYNDDDD